MREWRFGGMLALAVGIVLGGRQLLSTSQPPTEGPAVGGTPAWFLQGSFPDPTGRTIVDSSGRVTVPPRTGDGGRGAAGNPADASLPTPVVDTPACRRSPLCGSRIGRTRQSLQRVEWKQTLAYTFAYPMCCRPALAASRRSRSIRRAICGRFSARTPGNRSCSSSIRITRSSFRLARTSSAIRTRRTGWRSMPTITSGLPPRTAPP